MTNLGTATVHVDVDDSKLDKGLTNVKNKATAAGGVMKTALGTAAGFAAAEIGINGISSAFDLGIGNAMNFEKSLGAVRAATGASAEEMKAMRAEALKIGADTSKSASEAVLAMGELAKAGMPVQTILDGAGRSAVQMAEATGIDVPAAAILMSNALNTFSADGMKAADAAEVFSRVAGASAIDVNDLGMSLSAVGPVASASGLNMEEFGRAMGLMGNNALRGSDAGTSLKAVLAGLTPSSDKAANAMKKIGFSAFDANGDFKDMRTIIGELSTSLEGMTQQQRATTLELLFGSDGVRAANILLKEGQEGWDEFGEAMAKAPSIAEQSQMRMEGLAGSIEILKGSIETVSIVFGTIFLGALAKGVKGLTELVNAIIPTVEAFLKFEGTKVVLAGVAEGLRLIGAAVKLIPKEVLIGLGVALGLLAAKALVIGIVGLALAVKGLAVALAGASIAALGITGPVIAIVAAIALVVAAVLLAIKHFDDIKRVVGEVGDFIMDHWLLVGLALIAITGPIGIMTLAVIKHFGEIKDFITGAVSTVVTTVTDSFNAVKDFVTKAISDTLAFIDAHWRTIILLLLGPLGYVILVIEHNFQTIKDTISNALNAIAGVIESVWNAALGLITSVVDAIVQHVTNKFNEKVQAVTTAVNAVLSVITAVWTAVRDFVTMIATEVYNFVAARFNEMIGAVSGPVNEIVRVITDGFNTAKDAVLGVLSEIVGAIYGQAAEAFNAAVTFGANIYLGVKGEVEDLVNALYDIGAGMVTGLWKGIESNLGWIKDKVSSFVGGIVKAAGDAAGFHSPAVKFIEIGGGMVDGLVVGMDDKRNDANAQMQELVNGIWQIASDETYGSAHRIVVRDMNRAGNEMIDGLTAGVEIGSRGLQDRLDSVVISVQQRAQQIREFSQQAFDALSSAEQAQQRANAIREQTQIQQARQYESANKYTGMYGGATFSATSQSNLDSMAAALANARAMGYTLPPGYAVGGRPPPGMPSIVGEHGWELFVPDRRGTVYSHEDAEGMLGTNIEVILNNATVYARDKIDAERGAGDLGWGIAEAARGRGMRL